MTDSDNILPRTMSPDVLSALQGVCFIAQHIKDADKDNEVRLPAASSYNEPLAIPHVYQISIFVYPV